ncbi:DUF2017 family protein [Kytococcus sp. Marseille-QA3725]
MARAFRWEGDAAVAHLDDLELDALADGATAVITILGGGRESTALPGAPELHDPDQDDVDARFEALTADLAPAVPDDALDLFGDDPALARLLPAAHATDAERAREFAQMAHSGIRSTKVANLRTLVAACERSRESGVLALESAEARKVLAAFTDIRLVLADRLGIHEDGDAEQVEARTSELIAAAERGENLGDEEEIALQLGLHHGFVGWMQETLVEALLPG